MTLLRLVGVTKRFGGLVAVNAVTLEIALGEAVGIVGPNGSGKTTLFNVVSGVYRPESGAVLFEERDITRLAPWARARLGIGRTFQIPRPFSQATVRENVAIGAMFGRLGDRLDVKAALALADEYLALTQFSGRGDAISGSLTPVERKTMEIARALAMKPKLLLLDEALAGLPPRDIDGMVRLLRSVKEREGIAIVAMVEHIMRAVTGFADRVIVMHQGRKFLDAPTREALGDPRVLDIYLGRPESSSDNRPPERSIVGSN